MKLLKKNYTQEKGGFRTDKGGYRTDNPPRRVIGPITPSRKGGYRTDNPPTKGGLWEFGGPGKPPWTNTVMQSQA